MQDPAKAAFDELREGGLCPFCEGFPSTRVLKETSNFWLVADYAPLVEGHLLIIPRQHYACYGEVPAELDAELNALKDEVQHFLLAVYGPGTFWEHGVFHQSVFHAHLHAIPFGISEYQLEESIQCTRIESQDQIRRWFEEQGHYFYFEDTRKGYLFVPEQERYQQIARDVLWRGMQERYGREVRWRSPQQRHAEGHTQVEALMHKWRQFQEQGEKTHGNETSTRRVD